MEPTLKQAQIELELAIAFRIKVANEVEIEEFYDINGEISLGLKLIQKIFPAWFSGAGKKITKRIIRFKGIDP